MAAFRCHPAQGMSRRTGSDFGGHTPAGPKVFRAKIQGQRNKLAKPPATETRRGAGGTGHSPSATYLFPAILDRLALDIYPRRPCTNRGDSRLVRCLRLVDTPPVTRTSYGENEPRSAVTEKPDSLRTAGPPVASRNAASWCSAKNAGTRRTDRRAALEVRYSLLLTRLPAGPVAAVCKVARWRLIRGA
jgi:hypothetical protein